MTYKCTLEKLDCVCIGDGFLKTFFGKTKNMTPEERADYLEEDDVGKIFCNILNDAHCY